MKKIFGLLIIIPLIISTASAQFIKADLQAAGLTCSMCSRAIDKQLGTLDFIDSIGVELNTATFILYFDKDKTVDFDVIKKKVEDAGFSVASLTATYSFSNMKIGDNADFTYKNDTFYFIDPASQVLNGDVAFKIVDKGFVSDKEYEKYAGKIKAATITENSFHAIL